MPDEGNQMVLDSIKIRFGGVTRYNLDTASVIETKPFLLGSINRVDFKRGDASTKTIYAWVPEIDIKTGKPKGSIEFFTDLDQLIPFVSRTPERRTWKESLLLKLDPVDIISGIIAIVMTLTMILVILIQVTAGKSLDVPLPLSSGITTILGFYFGRATVSRNQNTDAVS